MSARRRLAVVAIALAALACGKSSSKASAGKTGGSAGNGGITASPATTIPGHDRVPEDTTPKEAPRLVPAESYVRTYLQLFGGLAPIDAQAQARAGKSLFDTWNDYLSALGFPDYRVDIPRLGQTNAIMLATFERLGVALCDRAADMDLGATAPPVDQRVVYAFDVPDAVLDQAGFDQRFDVLHRAFLGYPAALAPPEREPRFFKLYTDTVTAHAAKGAPSSVLKPVVAGWALVCQGLVRHPEFHFY